MSSKMRMFYPYPRGRTPQNEDKVSVKISKEFKLRNYVREQTEMKATPCIYELSLVLNCLKQTHYQDLECLDEVGHFRNCYMQAVKADLAVKERRKKPHMSGVTDKLLSVEINNLFSKYEKGKSRKH